MSIRDFFRTKSVQTTAPYRTTSKANCHQCKAYREEYEKAQEEISRLNKQLEEFIAKSAAIIPHQGNETHCKKCGKKSNIGGGVNRVFCQKKCYPVQHLHTKCIWCKAEWAEHCEDTPK